MHVTSPELSIVVPCLNEERVVGEFVEWCWEGLRSANVDGEVVIVDSSTDSSAEIAESKGARVLRFERRGLGRAYIDAIPHIRGKYVLMGDCDLTYDFRQLGPFVEQLRAGHDFVMGSRFEGSIEQGAMPKLHQYFGTPLTTWFLNLIYRTKFTDIHCGMRAMTLEALKQMHLRSQSWEYASEIVAKSALLGLNSTEVPVSFYRDRPGRESHHRRIGFLSPWLAGLENLKVMLIYAPKLFLLLPGVIALILGIAITAPLASGPFSIGEIRFELHWMLLGTILTVMGLNGIQLGLLAELSTASEIRLREEYSFARRLPQIVTFTRGFLAAGLLALVGIALTISLIETWISHDFKLVGLDYSALFGLLLLVVSFQLFGFTLLLQITERRRED